jgi:hypothetical protein
MGLRVGAGAEVIPIRSLDLASYKPGAGFDLRADVVWGAFSTTSFEFGYRRWPFREYAAYAREQHFELARLGFLQRFYPLFFTKPRLHPYVGAGLTASFLDDVSVNIPDASTGGLTVFGGCEIPAAHERLRIDPYVRWEYDFETDYFYSSISFGAHLLWRVL